MPVYKSFFNRLVNTTNKLDQTKVKLTIGDSVHNHRVLTVSQVIRYLLTRKNSELRALGVELSAVYSLLRSDIVSSRFSLRTDAIDINEFINFYEDVVITQNLTTNKISRGAIGRTISTAV